MKLEMRSLFERLEEWLFKLRRRNPFATFNEATDETKRFRELVESTKCPACQNKTLELAKFERGPKGWETDIKCENCDFNGVVSGLSTVLFNVNSKGKAVSTTKRKTTT